MAKTLVTFHAHPDDEAIATGGVMAQAAAQGHRVVLVVATRGERGEVADGFLRDEETLAERRTVETMRAAEILGVARVEFLGYHDSGFIDAPTNHDPASFCQADVDEAATRLTKILHEEHAEVLTIYDENGVYGHPDHIQVHRVGARAAEIARTPVVYEQTLDRDYIRGLMASDAVTTLHESVERPDVEEFNMGVSSDLITTVVDVRDFVDQKRAAMAAHASQIDENSFFLSLPPDAFRKGFGQEWFIRRGAPPGTRETSVLGD